MFATDVVAVACPYCGESFEAIVDCSVEQQQYVEDCFVCCRPIVFCVAVDTHGAISVATSMEND